MLKMAACPVKFDEVSADFSGAEPPEGTEEHGGPRSRLPPVPCLTRGFCFTLFSELLWARLTWARKLTIFWSLAMVLHLKCFDNCRQWVRVSDSGLMNSSR